MKGYSYEYCPTESAVGGPLLYISNPLSYKHRNYLCICKSIELESTFIEILNSKKTNVIAGCIYWHPHMDLKNKNKNQPTRIRNNLKTLIDNVYSNIITPNNISGNITATISDHLSQFFIAPNIFSNPLSIKLNVFDQENFILHYLSLD